MPKFHLSPIARLSSNAKPLESWDLQWTTASHPDLQAFELTQGTQQYQAEVQWLAPGEGVLLWRNQRIPFFAHQQEGILSVWCQGQTVQFEVQDTNHGRGRASGGDDGFQECIAAPMPGTVLKVLVQSGQTVEAKQPVIIMESMKMEMTLSAPAKAVVEAVLVIENQLLDIKAELVRFKPPST